MSSYSVNIAGRVDNMRLAKSEALVPLFEAIVNSIQAIEDVSSADIKGSITVEVNRLETLDADNLPEGEITGFTIVDNGIGFDEVNFRSFLESDSRHKKDRGGHGVGRLCWLKAFADVSIESVFRADGVCNKRSFVFSTAANEINDVVKVIEEQPSGSVVELRHIKKEYQPFIPAKTEDIAEAIMSHCLVYLLGESCPSITVVDGGKSIAVNEMLHDLLDSDSRADAFTIKENVFEILHIKLHASNVAGKKTPGSKLILCANMRSVMEKSMEKFLNGLAPWLLGQYGFVYTGVLTSPYLDENVDASRTSFTLPDKGKNLLYDISIEEIVESAQRKTRDFLGEYFEAAREETRESVKAYVINEAPQYRHLLAYASEDIDAIKFGANEETIDDALYKANRKFEKSIRVENKKLIDKLENVAVGSDNYEVEFARYVERASDANKAALANYVAHRKAILELFKKGLTRADGEKYKKEEYIHRLIYPMRASSEETAYGAHNLWLIDERLTYSTYISSDLPFGGKNGEERPDIMCLQQPVFMSSEENRGGVYDSVILFELKRPMRDDYNEKDNPITQLLGYAKKIRSGHALDANNRPIQVSNSTRMYLYAVCDITPTLKSVLDERGFNVTADGTGRFMFNTVFNAYIEVLPFDKIVHDSEMRNKAFFKTLGIE